MSEPGKTLPRPRQVTMAGWMIMLGSAFVVVTGYEVISGLRSLQSRDAVEKFLSEPPGDGLGLSVESALSILHGSAMIAAGCATAAGVLGFHILKRNRGARIALTVLAVPLFLAGIVTGGFMSSLVAVASVMLWLQPARDWFDGKAAPPVERAPEQRAPVWPPPVPPTEQPPADPRAFDGFGKTLTAPFSTGAGKPVTDVRRPDILVVAAIITWVFAGFALISSVIGIAVVASSPDVLLDQISEQNPELASQGVTDATLIASTYFMGAVTVAWSALACVCAALMLRRSARAALALLVLSAFTAAICFVSTLASVVLALPALAAIVVVALLRRADSRAWFATGPSPVRPTYRPPAGG
ncbi:hypothetical protein [Nocardioides sp. InS609-2]|uniref:hypothetical protein n=1 Tax=Nocardioides sp. InS609-2 TaxID=2760705 RepID=UPI0020BE2926|nr:hypothetical protein [Nocardioides sp. InS609-2]